MCVDGTKSSRLSCPRGVPQGSVLDQLYINVLPELSKDVNVQLYADDVVILANENNLRIFIYLLWLQCSGLAKSVYYWIQSKPCDDVYQRCVPERGGAWCCSEFIYLGVTLDSILTLKSHVKQLSNKLRVLSILGHFWRGC